MEGVIEMCGLLMIGLPARESHIREAERSREDGARWRSRYGWTGANIQKTKAGVSELQGINVETSHSTDIAFVP